MTEEVLEVSARRPWGSLALESGGGVGPPVADRPPLDALDFIKDMEILRKSSLVRTLSKHLSDTMPQGYAEEGQEKGKKKKWWGELFKRRARKVSDSSSDEEEEGKKKGFLSRRKKHDRGSKDVTNSFLINPGIKEARGRSLESVRSTGTQAGKKRIKAKVEASREQLAKDSSSDEGSSYTSSLPSGGSFPRRSRAARTERHNRRLWSASVVYQESNDYDTKYRAKTRSATPSPAASPKVRQRASSHDAVAPPPPPRRMDVPKYHPPVYTAPNQHRNKPRFNGLTHHSSDPVIPRDWMDNSVTEEKKPPAPPRRLPSTEDKRRQANLEEALNELEAIYKKLEDLQEPPDEDVEPLVTDDMAYRRLNKREPSSQDVREIMSQAGSYLLVSPTLSPPPITAISPTGIEPDITFDDVVFRSMNHMNNTLKIVDPQPPFGIPLGPISPAANSDYLHAKPTFEYNPPNTPDVVRDDLAFRNLRKDSQDLRKKKAVRSLSANLSNVILKNNNNFNAVNNNIEGRSHSYSDIPEEMRLAQRVLDMRWMKKVGIKRPQIPKINNEELRRRFFAESATTSEKDLLKELEDEAKATSLELEQQLSKSKTDALYSRSMADLLKELTKNLDSDFGQEAVAGQCLTCGVQDPSKQSGRDSANNNCYNLIEPTPLYKSSSPRPERPRLIKEQALSSIDSPDSRKKLQSFQSVPQYKPLSPNFRERPKPNSSPSNENNKDIKAFAPYKSHSPKMDRIRYNNSCENLPKAPKKLESPRPWDSYRREDMSRRLESSKPRDTLDELYFNLSNYKPESPRLRDRCNYRPELQSSSLKLKSEAPKPWDNFKGRSESYHGPLQHRHSPNSWEPSSNAFRRETPSPRQQFREGSPRRWERSMEEVHKENFQTSQSFRRLSPRHMAAQRVENEPKEFRLSPQLYKPQSPKPWMGFLNGSENVPRESYQMGQRRDRSHSPQSWQPNINGTKSLDEQNFISSESLSPRPRWSSLKDRSVQETYIGPENDKPWQTCLSGIKTMDECFIPSALGNPKPRWSSMKERPLETNLGALREGHIDSSKWLNSKSLEPRPNLCIEYRKDTRNRWNPSDADFKDKESQDCVPQKKVKHPAPWRHSLDSEGKVFNSDSSQNTDKIISESHRNSLIDNGEIRSTKTEETSPKPWEELDQICKKMQSETYDYNLSKSVTPEVKTEASPICWEPNDLGGSEVRSEEEKPEDASRLCPNWRPESSDSASAITSPDSPKASNCRKSPSLSKRDFQPQLGAIGENWIRRESPQKREMFVDRMFPDQERTPTLLSSSPIDVAAMEAESEEDDKQGQGVSQKPATPVNTTENVQL